MFDYEKLLFDALEIPNFLNASPGSFRDGNFEAPRKLDLTPLHPHKVKHVACLKAGGLGISEFVLRWIAWKCLVDDSLKGSQVVIFTGPRLELAVSLISRARFIFTNHGITFEDKETVLNLNGVRIEVFPSHHADSARGLPNISIIFADEFSFFPDHEIDNIMDIMLRNVPKSNPYLLAVSTPQKVNDAMDRLLKEPADTSPFKRLMLDWAYGVGKIYSKEDIDKIKNSRGFEREFCLKFISTEGNIFTQSSIDRAIELGRQYPITTTYDPTAQHIMGIDPGFGSSACAFCVLEYSDDIIKVVYADQFEKAAFNDMVTKAYELYTTMNIDCILVDIANPEYIEAVKAEIGEDSNWFRIHETLAKYRHNGWDIMKANVMKVIPVSFAQDGSSMLLHAKQLLEFDEPIVAINPKWDKLITALRGAVGVEYKLSE